MKTRFIWRVSLELARDLFPLSRYAEEWAVFWQNRYAEVQAAGQDPDQHNYLADWIPFWGRRVRELALEEVRIKRHQLQIQFGIGESCAMQISARSSGTIAVQYQHRKSLLIASFNTNINLIKNLIKKRIMRNLGH